MKEVKCNSECGNGFCCTTTQSLIGAPVIESMFLRPNTKFYDIGIKDQALMVSQNMCKHYTCEGCNRYDERPNCCKEFPEEEMQYILPKNCSLKRHTDYILEELDEITINTAEENMRAIMLDEESIFVNAESDLECICASATDGNEESQQYVCELWNEQWENIKKKLETEGSVWYVWWQDGVKKHMGLMLLNHEQTLNNS